MPSGASTDRHLAIPGEDLAGSHAATEFVAWYNGHPDYVARTFDLTQRSAVVIGIGNVTMDLVRIMASHPDHLAHDRSLPARARSAAHRRPREIHILARRGPVQAACTTPELRELGELADVDLVVDPRDLELDPVSAALLERDADRTALNNLALLREYGARSPSGAAAGSFRFCTSPVELLGRGHVEAVASVRNTLVPDGHGGVPGGADRESAS